MSHSFVLSFLLPLSTLGSGQMKLLTGSVLIELSCTIRNC